MTDDQKRALGIGGVAVGGFLLYRYMHKTTSTVAGGKGAPALTNATVGGSITPYTPQNPVVLQPGESVYDPNTEGLVNTPTAMPAKPQAVTPAAPSYVVKVNYPKPTGMTRTRRKPAKRKVVKK
jgi:hypothetical protein